jgi:preprotein translocase subunit SecE
MQKLMQYLRDVRAEMLKVSWPTRNELTGATLLVIILSVIISLFVFACDQVLQILMKLFLQST